MKHHKKLAALLAVAMIGAILTAVVASPAIAEAGSGSTDFGQDLNKQKDWSLPRTSSE